MKTVLVAGATGYLGRQIVKHYHCSAYWKVRALVRNAELAKASGLEADEWFEGEATDSQSLCGVMEDVDVVVSALGITRQRDGLSYEDVDYQANANLLQAAVEANVSRFAYVHVLHADAMQGVPLVDAKRKFTQQLRSAPIESTVVCPSGFYSDMGDFYAMAKAGRIWLFGNGSRKLNPIDGADLALVIAEAIEQGTDWIDVGGPDTLSQQELAELAFAALGKSAKITYLPDFIRRASLRLLPWITPVHIHGPARFFLSAMGMDMVGEPRGTRKLIDHFAALRRQDEVLPSALDESVLAEKGGKLS